MPTVRPKKSYVAPKTDGLFTVRDNLKDGGQIWGDDLTYADATKLKNEVAGSGKSRTVTIVHKGSPSEALPLKNAIHTPSGATLYTDGSVDLELGRAREAALRAAAPVAQQANIRANTLPPPSTLRPPAASPPSPTITEKMDLSDADVGNISDLGLDDDDISGILGEVGGGPTTDDLQRANDQADEDWKAADERMRELEKAKAPIPVDLVARVGRVPHGYRKRDEHSGVWETVG